MYVVSLSGVAGLPSSPRIPEENESAIEKISARRREEQYVLTSQLWRAVDSIILNIAEGSDRYSDLDFSRFLNQALTSLYEVVGCIDLALDDGYIMAEEHQDVLHDAEEIARQLSAFTASVRNSAQSPPVV